MDDEDDCDDGGGGDGDDEPLLAMTADHLSANWIGTTPVSLLYTVLELLSSPVSMLLTLALISASTDLLRSSMV